MILEYVKPDTKQVLYTHSSFIDQEKSFKIFQNQKKRRGYQNNLIVASLISSTWLIANKTVRNIIPKKIPSWAFVLGTSFLTLVVCQLCDIIQKPLMRDINKAMYSSKLPLWRNKRDVPNLDRIFFCLDDDLDQKINLIHHGMSPERAQAVFPIEIAVPIYNRVDELV